MEVKSTHVATTLAAAILFFGAYFAWAPVTQVAKRAFATDNYATQNLPVAQKLAAQKVQEYCYPGVLQRVAHGFDLPTCQAWKQKELDAMIGGEAYGADLGRQAPVVYNVTAQGQPVNYNNNLDNWR